MSKRMRALKPDEVTLGKRLLWSLALVCGIAGAADAKAPSRNGKAPGCVMTQDPAQLEQLVSFLRAYHQAIAASDRGFLSAHTRFPLPFQMATYDMEAKAKRRVLPSVDGLLKDKETLLWPAVLLPKSAAALSQVRRGQQKCSDPQSPEVPDFEKGEPAFSLGGCEVSFTYLSNACESETHLVTLRFAKGDKGWQLVERSVRMGTK